MAAARTTSAQGLLPEAKRAAPYPVGASRPDRRGRLDDFVYPPASRHARDVVAISHRGALRYGVFLLLLRSWVEFAKSRFNPRAGEIEKHLAEAAVDHPLAADHNRRAPWLDWLDIPSGFNPDEGCIFALLIGVVLALIGLLIFAILSASALLAEVFLDAFIISALYRRLRIAAEAHWLGTAVRKTWVLALITAALLSLSGWCLESLAPGSQSIGAALGRLWQDQPQNSPQP
jgi:hypothetical protein